MTLASPDRLKKILDDRMKRLAEPLVQEASAETLLSVAVFQLGKELYALELAALHEILPFQRWTPIPSAPPEILGVMNIRGDIRPILSLQRLLSLPIPEEEKEGHVVLLAHSTGLIGLRVDQVVDVQTFSKERVIAFHEKPHSGPAFLRGWTKEGLIILEAKTISEWNLPH